MESIQLGTRSGICREKPAASSACASVSYSVKGLAREVLLEEAVDRVYPLVAGAGVSRPEVKLRKMRSQWGNCHWRQGYITLNTALARCPETLRDYVALHELVHFVHPDHGPGFYGLMDRLMPDWRQRRKELRRYGGALAG